MVSVFIYIIYVEGVRALYIYIYRFDRNDTQDVLEIRLNCIFNKCINTVDELSVCHKL